MTNCRIPLNFPLTPCKTRLRGEREEVWDDIRKKWLVLTPEEWVRRQAIGYLVSRRGVAPQLIRQEEPLSLHGTARRADIVVYDPQARPRLMVECKAPQVKLTRQVLEQAARYNLVLKIPYILITNGLEHYCYRWDEAGNRLLAMDGIPFFD